MADRFPLIVNATSRKIEELVAGDNLDLSGNGIIVSGDIGDGKYLKSDGGVVVWDEPGNVYLNASQTLTNKTIEASTISGSLNTITNLPNSSLVNSGITINGTTVSLGGSVATPNDNTTYSISVADGLTADQKIIRLTDSASVTDDVIFAVGSPATIPAGSNPLTLNLVKDGDKITITGTVVDNNTITSLQSSTGGTAQTGAMKISGSGGATVTQDTATKTINIDTRNDDTITQIRSGTGTVYSSGDFTFLAGTAVTLSQADTANPGETEITIASSDTVTRVKGGTSGSFVSGDVTFSGGSHLGGNVTVQQTGNTIEIDSTDTNTVTQIGSGTEVLQAGNFRFKQSGATTITQTVDGTTGEIEIEISSVNTDSGANFGAGEGITFSSNQFSIKNSTNLIDNRILVWDDAQGQVTNSSITDSGTVVTIDGDLIVLGDNTVLETSTLQVEDNTIELRKGTDLVGTDAGIQVNRTTDATGAITSYNTLQWFESGGYWRSYDGSVSNRFVTENEAQTLTQKILDSPTLVNPVLGAATATTYNGLTIDTTSGSALDIADLKTITFNNTLGFLGTDGSSIDFGNGGGAGAKVAYDSFHLGQFALTTSTQLSGKIQDKSGSGKLVFNTSPTFVTSITTSSSSIDVFNTTADGVNFAGAATQIEIGASNGTTSINNSLTVDNNTTLGTDNTNTHTINGAANFETNDITIRGTATEPIYVGRGGGAVASNTRLGYAALGANQSGAQNTAIGYAGLINNVSGAANTVIGYQAGRDNEGGNNNIFIGKDSGLINTTGSGNIAIGVNSMENNPSSNYNVCIGHFAGNAVTGVGNVIIGPADTQDTLSPTFSPPSASGDRQLVIGSGTGAWIRGDFNFNVSLPNNLDVDGDCRILGDLTVAGSTVAINSSTLTIDDKNIELAAVANLTITANIQNGSTTLNDVSPVSGIIAGMGISSPAGSIPTGTTVVSIDPGTRVMVLSNAVSSASGVETFIVTGPTDTAANGGGVVVKGTPVSLGGTGDKTILYDHSRTDKYWVSSENLELGSGKKFAIGNQKVLDLTSLGDTVVNSKLTSVGVLSVPAGETNPALEVDGSIVLGGRVIEETFSNFSTNFTVTGNTLNVVTAAANTILGTTPTSAINTWAFDTADANGNILGNNQSITVTLIIDANTAATYGDDCTVDGNTIANGVRWSGGSPPIPTTNTDILTFIIVKDGSGVVRVFGQGNTDFS